jgi:trigger factor
LDITLDKKSSTEASVKIKLNEADYQPKVDEKIKEYRKKVQLKGFRPGKVPATLIKKMYGTSILVDEINHIVSHALTDYIRDNKIQLLAEPMPNTEKAKDIDWENQKEFEFEYEIGFVEEFSYDVSKRKKVTAYEITVDEKIVDEAIENVQKQFGKMENPEAAEAGDMLFGQLKAVEGDFDEQVVLPIEEIEESAQKQFIGAKKEDTIKFDLRKTFKDEAALASVLNKSEEEVKELNGEFELSVKNVNRSVAAELNQELFDKVFGEGEVSSEEEFKNKVKETIAENYKRESDAMLSRHIVDKFVDLTKIDLPDEFLKNSLKRSNEKITDEVLEREYPIYVRDLKWSLISNKIAADNEIKVEHAEVLDKTKAMIQEQLGASGLAGQLGDQLDAFADNYLQGENGQNYQRMFDQVRSDKILEFVKEKINITTEEVDVEKFKEIASA